MNKDIPKHLYRVSVPRMMREVYEVEAWSALDARRKLKTWFTGPSKAVEGVNDEPVEEIHVGASLRGWEVQRVD